MQNESCFPLVLEGENGFLTSTKTFVSWLVIYLKQLDIPQFWVFHQMRGALYFPILERFLQHEESCNLFLIYRNGANNSFYNSCMVSPHTTLANKRASWNMKLNIIPKFTTKSSFFLMIWLLYGLAVDFF